MYVLYYRPMPDWRAHVVGHYLTVQQAIEARLRALTAPTDAYAEPVTNASLFIRRIDD